MSGGIVLVDAPHPKPPAPPRFRLWSENWRYLASTDDILDEHITRGAARVVIDANTDAARVLLDCRDGRINVTVEGGDSRFVGVLKSWSLAPAHGRHGRRELTVRATDYSTMLSGFLIWPPLPLTDTEEDRP
ncbi:hypothetical protein TSOC111612_01455 [Tsukamurella ocularis]|uniref:hypothetical protein n=1 Tax=Tsukamurella ocularis TaxID=1970234 RepID=UPI0039EEE9C1